MAKKQKAFRLDENILHELETLCNEWNINQTEAVERVIHLAFESYTDSYTETEQSYTKDQTLDSAFKALEKQLEVKDVQIETLNKALLNAQEQGKAAQVLHAVEKKEDLLLESQDAKQVKKPWWKFWK